MRIPFVSDALYRRKLRRELIKTAHHDYFRMLADNESLRAEVKSLRDQCRESLREGRAMAVKTQDLTVAANRLATTFQEYGTWDGVASSLTCGEVDAMATLLAVVGKSDEALLWLENHTELSDDEKDTHRVDEHGKPIDLKEYLLDLAA
ncbi:hypothetical protein Q3V23_23370 [Streptomyces sp. VNUA116]|uniref:hypothetical protein n=1 Tax=Streptomyces sp. VNUA116 TaxID=3062449 RepID=UPI0026759C81|nr:hypothetical protein [Streptomyces sp. VNUA116]WKU46764.1 hypothetical protein Q3V23_23370 [Streptomyces sp. VNUA116]